MSRCSSLLFALAMATMVCSASPPGPSGGALCAETLAKLGSKLKSTRTLKSLFVHTLVAKSLHQTEREEGTLVLARGGKMRWDYSIPSGKLAWADGKKSYLYTPEDRQVLIQPLDASLPIRLLMGTADLSRECRCVGATRLAGETTLSLEMLDGEAGIRDLTLRMEDRRGVVTYLAYKDALGNEISLAFTEIEVDAAIPDSAFKIPVPKGARVIENP